VSCPGDFVSGAPPPTARLTLDLADWLGLSRVDYCFHYHRDGPLGVPLSVILAFVRAKTTHFAQADWFWSIISFAFFTSFAVVITPTFDMTARHFAEYVGSFLLGVIIVSRFR
jgi:hypothetical protein